MANRALYIDSLMPMADRMVEMGQKTKEGWKQRAENGRMFRDTYLAIAHGEQMGVVSMADSTADLRAFRRMADDWEAGMLQLARMARKQDPQWFATWGGPRGKL
jgi:hypothetical protein